MDIAGSTQWQQVVAGKGKTVEAQLEALKLKNRLALHCYEYADDMRTFPTDTQECLQNNQRFFKQATTPTPEDKVALLSMTLLPSKPGKSVNPYEFESHHLGSTIGYLFNLDNANDSTAARVARIFPQGGNTGSDNYNKILQLRKKTDIDPLDSYYRHFRDTHPDDYKAQRDAVLQDVWTKPSLASAHLDLLAKSINDTRDNRLNLNEILVAASPEHISAIVVPVDVHYQKVSRAAALLRGALTGLDHAQRGQELPVVLYHLSSPGQGRFEYVAQGQEECKAAAFNAIEALRSTPYPKPSEEALHELDILNAHAKKLLGVDISVPLAQQGVTLPSGHKR